MLCRSDLGVQQWGKATKNDGKGWVERSITGLCTGRGKKRGWGGREQKVSSAPVGWAVQKESGELVEMASSGNERRLKGMRRWSEVEGCGTESRALGLAGISSGER